MQQVKECSHVPSCMNSHLFYDTLRSYWDLKTTTHVWLTGVIKQGRVESGYTTLTAIIKTNTENADAWQIFSAFFLVSYNIFYWKLGGHVPLVPLKNLSLCD